MKCFPRKTCQKLVTGQDHHVLQFNNQYKGLQRVLGTEDNQPTKNAHQMLHLDNALLACFVHFTQAIQSSHCAPSDFPTVFRRHASQNSLEQRPSLEWFCSAIQ